MLRSQSRLLLKEQLQIQKYMDDGGAVRYTIKPVVGELTFDKVQHIWHRSVNLCFRLYRWMLCLIVTCGQALEAMVQLSCHC